MLTGKDKNANTLHTKIKVGAVSYLNTKPLIYGFEQGLMKGQIDLIFDYPSLVAKKLLANEIDIGLVPVAVLPKMKTYHIVSNYCIGSNGPVASVCLFSDVPLAKIKNILLDYQSNTSVALLKILIKEYWKISPKLTPAKNNFEKDIAGTTAGLVIGDRAFEQRVHNKYVYDLGEAWTAMTALPFVYAAWISNKKIEEVFVKSFNQANGLGMQHIAKIASKNAIKNYNSLAYYTNNIQYHLSMQMKKGLALFLKKIG